MTERAAVLFVSRDRFALRVTEIGGAGAANFVDGEVGADLGAALGAALREAGLAAGAPAGFDVLLSAADALAAPLEVPVREERRIRAILPALLEPLVPRGDVGAWEVRFGALDCGGSAGGSAKRCVLACAFPRLRLKELLLALRNAGIEPDSVRAFAEGAIAGLLAGGDAQDGVHVVFTPGEAALARFQRGKCGSFRSLRLPRAPSFAWLLREAGRTLEGAADGAGSGAAAAETRGRPRIILRGLPVGFSDAPPASVGPYPVELLPIQESTPAAHALALAATRPGGIAPPRAGEFLSGVLAPFKRRRSFLARFSGPLRATAAALALLGVGLAIQASRLQSGTSSAAKPLFEKEKNLWARLVPGETYRPGGLGTRLAAVLEAKRAAGPLANTSPTPKSVIPLLDALAGSYPDPNRLQIEIDEIHLGPEGLRLVGRLKSPMTSRAGDLANLEEAFLKIPSAKIKTSETRNEEMGVRFEYVIEVPKEGA